MIAMSFSISSVDALVYVNLGLLADKISEPASKTLNLGKTKDGPPFALNISVENMQDVLALASLYHRHTPAG